MMVVNRLQYKDLFRAQADLTERLSVLSHNDLEIFARREGFFLLSEAKKLRERYYGL
jgi:hypothetical protein